MENLPEVIEQSINVLSEKLGAPAETLLEFAINGVVLEGFIHTLMAFALLTVGVVSGFISFKHSKKIENGYDDIHISITMFLGALSCVIIIVSVLAITKSSPIIQWLAPEYWILKQLIM